ncbi:hypothetical protein [Enorma phocaeensis]|uniref:hypothetical protein n=1 Tax=Enorma phocaeensis TaxID=1871019 RepID=UPI0011AF4835|nr:hypothetical protein [Enorma phocaeensis]
MAALVLWCVLLAALLFSCAAGTPPSAEDVEEAAAGASSPDDAVPEGSGNAAFEGDMPADAAGARGGGDVIRDGSVVYWADGAGIMRLALDGANEQEVAEEPQTDAEDPQQDAEPVRVYEGPASCLNISGDDLYAVVSAAQGDTRIVRLVGARGNDAPAVQEVYATTGTLTDMLVRDGWVYAACLMPDEDPKAVAIDLARLDTPPVEHAYPGATALSLFWDEGSLLVHATDGAGWRLDEYAGAMARQPDATPVTLLSGSGAAQCPSCDGSSLYQGEQGADGAVRFVRREFSGGFQEYAELASAGLTACDASGCVVVTNTGAIAWIAETTGFSHDLAPAIESVLGEVGPSTVRIEVEDGLLYLVAEQGLYTVDVASDQASAEALYEDAR